MPDSLYHVAQAAETLAGPHGTVKEKLVKAGGEFWAAMIYREEWTPELQGRAERICQTLLAGGTVEMTVNKMDPDTAARTVTELTEAMARLAADIAAAKEGNRLPSQQSGFPRQYE
jgi:hypothetical protein